jgi:DNA mismatch repair protein MSH5
MAKLEHINWIEELAVIYYPLIGFEIAIRRSQNTSIEEQTNIAGMEYQFHTSSFVYFKNDTARQLDDTFGDIHNTIVDRELQIIAKLELRIRQSTEQLLRLSNALAQLDW